MAAKIAHEHLSPVTLAEPDGPAPLRRALDHAMLKIIQSPTRIQAAGTPPKTIEEFIGRVTSGTTALSVARIMKPLLQHLPLHTLLQ